MQNRLHPNYSVYITIAAIATTMIWVFCYFLNSDLYEQIIISILPLISLGIFFLQFIKQIKKNELFSNLIFVSISLSIVVVALIFLNSFSFLGVLFIGVFPALFFSKNKQHPTLSSFLFLGVTSVIFLIKWQGVFNLESPYPKELSKMFDVINGVFLFVWIILLYIKINLNEKGFEQNLEAEIKNAKISEVRAIESTRELKESVDYARLIQYNLLLDSIDSLNEQADYFLFYKPKDKVGGDFFWCKTLGEDRFVLLVGDCTGHGIPGGFLTMISITLLNQITTDDENINTEFVLQKLNDGLFKNFGSNYAQHSVKDSLDCSICIFNKREKTVEVSAVNSSVYILKKEDQFQHIHEIKGDKLFLGNALEKLNINSTCLHLSSEDMIYMYSDGVIDQFGGPKQKKLMKSRFKEFLASNGSLSCDAQKTNLSNMIYDWKGENEQTDDIIVAGIRMQ